MFRCLCRLASATNVHGSRRRAKTTTATATRNTQATCQEPRKSSSSPSPPVCMERVLSTEPLDGFINPFTGRLTSPRSGTGKEMLRVGFQRNHVNPFRLEWDRTRAPVLSPSALRPFTKSTIAWRKKLSELLSRTDAADAVADEVLRLYDALTSAYLPPKLDAVHDPQLSGLTLTPDQENVMACVMRGYSMFIGGSAGTGKTVLLKAIHRRLTEAGLRVAMTATTGVAAVQLGGCTFHLAFGVPVSDGFGRRRRWDLDALRAVDVVIIDEVSLLDTELFDAFEEEARLARMHALPFGGLQVIACGDFLQLANVDYLPTEPCYQSEVFQRLLAVRLTTPMRQAKDDPLYKLLTELRVGRFDSKVMKSLDRPLPPNTEDVTYIFPKRSDAQQLNDQKLCDLRSEEMVFTPQRGSLQLIGNFLPAALLALHSRRSREEILDVLHEEFRRVMMYDLTDHNVVVMPAAVERNYILIRLRIPEERRPVVGKGNSQNPTTHHSQKQSNSSNRMKHTSSQMAATPAVAVSGGGGVSLLAESWPKILATAAKRLGGFVQHYEEGACLKHVPLSVSLALASAASNQTVDCVVPLRLKLGCRVMINRNLSRTVSNGSVGVVEAFAPPNMDLFPRRHDVPSRLAYGRMLEKNIFPRLPVVRLLSGEVVQVPPVAYMIGGTPATYFYGHEIFSLPMQLGYAFTVHKVQGLTLQGTVLLDCKNFFSCPHLVYVACSRVRSLDQLVVRNINSNMVIVKRSALDFSSALKDAAIEESFVPSSMCVRGTWVGRQQAKLMGLSE